MTRRSILLLTALAAAACLPLAADPLDIAPFARPCCVSDQWTGQTTFEYGAAPGLQPASGGRWIYGLQWAEERDINHVLVHLANPYDSSSLRLEYWTSTWPYKPPAMPTIEDPVEDAWQGQWVTAKSRITCEERNCTIGFFPLDTAENPRAVNMPGITYRRTVKFRLVFTRKTRVESVEVLSETTGRAMQVRLRGAYQEFRAYNGSIRKVEPIPGGALLDLVVANPAPAGSSDITVIQVRNGDRSYAFAPADLDRGPIFIRPYDAYVTLASDTKPFSTAAFDYAASIRQRLAVEPEQSYERASREIPPLDPVKRQGQPVYLPLAADASWQKFALGWGGHVWISKRGTKAYGNELKRLTWPGDRIDWRLGTGSTPDFRPTAADSTLTTLDNYLPVTQAAWKQGNLEYRQESFATLLSGPLASDDPGRSEQTPAVLLMRLRIRNTGAAKETAHLWLGTTPDTALAWKNGLLLAGTDVRAAIHLPAGAHAQIASCTDKTVMPALHATPQVAAGAEAVVTIAIPFIPGLTPAEQAALRKLDFDAQRTRVVAYWRSVTDGKVPFEVPEARFNDFARGLIPRIRISATKDPKSGLYMVPAAAYNYQVYLNEAAFQAQLLDTYGEHALAAQYLQTGVDLQGSTPLVGTYTGDQKAAYHGARVDADYNYTASQYNLDHGTQLWTLGEHYLQTRDRAWLTRVLPSMKRAADWVTEQRRLTMQMDQGEKCVEYGLLPAGHLEDNRDWGHWFSVNAYASVGMTRLAELLHEIGDPDAARFARDAAAYHDDLRAAVQRATAQAPVTRLRDGSYVPWVPSRPHQRYRFFGPVRVAFYSRYNLPDVLPTFRLSATREVLYGPLILIDAGIFSAHEPLADWVLSDWEDNLTMSTTLGINPHGLVDEKLWFSQGGMVFQSNLQNPIRTYLRRGEVPAAIRNLYNDFVSCYYPTVNLFTEEFRQWRWPSGPFYKIPDEAKFVQRLRDALVMEYDGGLYLATGTPRAWLEPGKRITVTNAPTWYGPVSYQLSSAAGSITADVHLPRRSAPGHATLGIRPPAGQRIGQVLINGKPYTDFDVTSGRIRLPRDTPDLQVEVKLK